MQGDIECRNINNRHREKQIRMVWTSKKNGKVMTTTKSVKYKGTREMTIRKTTRT